MAAKGGASKNNVANRQKAKKIIYSGKEVTPVRFVSEEYGNYMAVQDTEGNMFEDSNGKPIAWGSINA